MFFIGDVFYIGLVLSMISGIATISTGLEIILDQVRIIASTDRSAHFSKDQSSLQGNKRKLLGMRILVGIIFVGFVTITTLIFTEVNVTLQDDLIFDCSVVFSLLVVYIYWFLKVLCEIRELQRSSLQLHSEHRKILW